MSRRRSSPVGAEHVGTRVHVTGVVQGVGFRPFVFNLAERHGLRGWVQNTSAGVEIEIEGDPEAVSRFVVALSEEAPPLARIDDVSATDIDLHGFHDFEIVPSKPVPGAFQPVSADVATCDDCVREMLDPGDRRHRYPFTNCTNCGPRFTIIEDIPYDRPNTTMASFALCERCAEEYADPRDRRFHAQPTACPECGPQVWLESEVEGSSEVSTGRRPSSPGDDRPADGQWRRGNDAIRMVREMLSDGRIVAVKGLGGFHLACDATNAAAVRELRRRKLRVDKPFALMVPDVSTVERHCIVDAASRLLLESVERPIVVMPRDEGSRVAEEVAPEQHHLGVMLPYTPLHHLLIEPAVGFPEALVMTSGNLSEEPIATTNDDARERLSGLADAILMHDRPIRTRCDDSVVRTFEDEVFPLRRSRGYAPFPVRLPWSGMPLLAAGAELKNTFCVTNDRFAFLSHHIGDMENLETLNAFEDGVAHMERLFRVQPVALAYDLHPDYMATAYALRRSVLEGLPAIGVQHHHAHVAALMAESGLSGDRPVIGIAFDGTGYGDDGAIWGGEVLVADYVGYERRFHLDYIPLAGGDIAVRNPWRVALAWLRHAEIDWADDLACVSAATDESLRVLGRQLELGLNAPPTSSMGRLFDAVASLAGVHQTVNYEAQAAIALEALADPDEPGCYPFPVRGDVLDADPLMQAIVSDVRDGIAVPRISARFHRAVAAVVVDACRQVRDETGLSEVALSGGVWQNLTLLQLTVAALRREGFAVLVHRHVPANDGGLALGQAAVAQARLTDSRV